MEIICILFTLGLLIWLIGLKLFLCIVLGIVLLGIVSNFEWQGLGKKDRRDELLPIAEEYLKRHRNSGKGEMELGRTPEGWIGWFIIEPETPDKAELLYTLRKSRSTGKYYFYYKDTTEKAFGFAYAHGELHIFPYREKDEYMYV